MFQKRKFAGKKKIKIKFTIFERLYGKLNNGNGSLQATKQRSYILLSFQKLNFPKFGQEKYYAFLFDTNIFVYKKLDNGHSSTLYNRIRFGYYTVQCVDWYCGEDHTTRYENTNCYDYSILDYQGLALSFTARLHTKDDDRCLVGGYFVNILSISRGSLTFNIEIK